MSGLILCTALVAQTSCREGAASDADADEHILDFDSATVRLVTKQDTISLKLQLAITVEQQNLGLMERRHLAERAGMLFVYDTIQPANGGFWMYRTRIPLDIAFLDSAGVVRATRAMVPCTERRSEGCPAYEPGTPYRYALEVNGGMFKRWGVERGARLLVEDLPPRRAAPMKPKRARAARP